MSYDDLTVEERKDIELERLVSDEHLARQQARANDYKALRESHDRLLGDNEVLKLQLSAKASTSGENVRRATLLEIAGLVRKQCDNIRVTNTPAWHIDMIISVLEQHAHELERMAGE